MKHTLFFLLFLLSFNFINIIAVEDNIEEFIVTDEHGNRSFTAYASYFLIKEYCKVFLLMPFIDLQKMKDASIFCCKANHENGARYLWVSLIFKFDEAPINELKNHIYKDSAEELASFVLQKCQEFELNCRECGQYSGYYIPEEDEKAK